MLNSHLQIHPAFIPVTSRVTILDFRLWPPARRGHVANAPEGFRIGGIATLYQL